RRRRVPRAARLAHRGAVGARVERHLALRAAPGRGRRHGRRGVAGDRRAPFQDGATIQGASPDRGVEEEMINPTARWIGRSATINQCADLAAADLPDGASEATTWMLLHVAALQHDRREGPWRDGEFIRFVLEAPPAEWRARHANVLRRPGKYVRAT